MPPAWRTSSAFRATTSSSSTSSSRRARSCTSARRARTPRRSPPTGSRAAAASARVAVTYGVGALNVVNAVAGAHAESSPVVVISGAPGVREQHEDPLIHHRFGPFTFQREIFERITCFTAVLDDPAIAYRQIDRALRAAQEQRKPAYIEIPRDLVGSAGIPHATGGCDARSTARPGEPGRSGRGDDRAARRGREPGDRRGRRVFTAPGNRTSSWSSWIHRVSRSPRRSRESP